MDIFTDDILTLTILDRVVYYSPIVIVNGINFRAKNQKKAEIICNFLFYKYGKQVWFTLLSEYLLSEVYLN